MTPTTVTRDFSMRPKGMRLIWHLQQTNILTRRYHWDQKRIRVCINDHPRRSRPTVAAYRTLSMTSIYVRAKGRRFQATPTKNRSQSMSSHPRMLFPRMLCMEEIKPFPTAPSLAHPLMTITTTTTPFLLQLSLSCSKPTQSWMVLSQHGDIQSQPSEHLTTLTPGDRLVRAIPTN